MSIQPAPMADTSIEGNGARREKKKLCSGFNAVAGIYLCWHGPGFPADTSRMRVPTHPPCDREPGSAGIARDNFREIFAIVFVFVIVSKLPALRLQCRVLIGPLRTRVCVCLGFTVHVQAAIDILRRSWCSNRDDLFCKQWCLSGPMASGLDSEAEETRRAFLFWTQRRSVRATVAMIYLVEKMSPEPCLKQNRCCTEPSKLWVSIPAEEENAACVP